MSEVPFYGNLPDDVHCFEASIRMVLGYFLPQKEFTWDEIDRLTGKKPGMWTCPNRAMVELAKMRFTVEGVQDFDIKDFATRGKDALTDIFGQQIAEEQAAHSDIPYEQAIAKEYVAHVRHQRRVPKIDDVRQYISDGFLVGCNVNAKALNGQEGYVGHFVIIYKVSESEITFHDPGLPAQKGRSVGVDAFRRAWEYPNKEAANITAFKLKEFKGV